MKESNLREQRSNSGKRRTDILSPRVASTQQSVFICVGWCLGESNHDIRKKQQSPEGETGMWRERARPVGQRAHVPNSKRAEPPPARHVPRRDPEAEAAPAHPEEPGLCRQLPSQAGVPARSPGAAEDGTPEGGGEARGGERRHEERAGGARRAPGRAPEVRPRPGGRRGQPASYGAAPQHRLSHHHRQESASATERSEAVLEGAAGPGGGRTTCNANTHIYTIHTHAGEQEDDFSRKILSTCLRYASFTFFKFYRIHICRSVDGVACDVT